MRSVSRKRDAAPRAARRPRRSDLAARLKLRTRALKARVERRDALIEAVREANGTRDSRKVGEWLVRQAQGWVPAPCWVVIAHDPNGHLNVLADTGLVPNLGPSLWSSANWVMRHSSEFFSGDLARDPRSGPGAVGSVIAFPLLCRNRSVGVLIGLDPMPSTSTPSMSASLVMALRELLEPSAIALDNSLALEKAEALSVTDDLTRLYELAVLEPRSADAKPSAPSRNGRALSLLFLDLDSFKQVNDQHGHLAGSKALVEAAAVIRGSARGRPTWSRASAATSFVNPARYRPEGRSMRWPSVSGSAMREARFLASDGLSVRLTASIGVATFLRTSAASGPRKKY